MTGQIPSFLSDFSHTVLPVVKKTVFRMGVAGSYGIDSADIRWAADYGANYWVWGRGFGDVTDGIREVIKGDRENHVVGMLGWGYFGWQGALRWFASFPGTLLPVCSDESECSRCVDRAAKPGAAESEYGCNKTRAVGAGRNELDQAVWSIGQIKEETRLREIMETSLKK